jgi:hypothetical protein
LTCAEPNLKLRPLLELKGFAIKQIKDNLEAYYFLHRI